MFYLRYMLYNSTINYRDTNMTSLCIDMPTVEQFKVKWLLPVSLQIDPDLNDEETEENQEVFYSDNLVVEVLFQGHAFEVTRRFLIRKRSSGVDIFVEEGWEWNEHGDLSSDEQDLFEFIIKKCPELFSPTEAFKEQLMAIL